MKTDNASNGSGSAATSKAPPAQLTESQYLAQQAEQAKAAIAQTLARMKDHLAQGVAPSAWAKQYPWMTVAAAAAAGFVAASTLIPSKEQQTLRKLAAIERAVNPPPPKSQHTNGKEHPEPVSFLSVILKEALAVARPALISLITAGIANAQQPPPAAPAETPHNDDSTV